MSELDLTRKELTKLLKEIRDPKKKLSSTDRLSNGEVVGDFALRYYAYKLYQRKNNNKSTE